MKKFLPIVVLLCLSLVGKAQTITAAGNVTDSDPVAWGNSLVQIQFYPNPSYPNTSTYNINGVPLTNYGLSFQGQTDTSGNFSIASIPNTTLISPAGSSYTIKICPNASVQCTILPTIALSGQSLTSYISAHILPIRFAAQGANTYGYTDGEVSPAPLQGAFYFNVTNLISRQWNGTIWQNFGSSGGTCTGCVITAPAAGVSQQITQLGSTSTDSNTLLGIHWVNSFYYPSNNGIATLGSGSLCTFATSGISGCSIGVSPYYPSTEIPNGSGGGNHAFGGDTNGPSSNPGTATYDYRNGQLSMFFHDPMSTGPPTLVGLSDYVAEDQSLLTMNTVNGQSTIPIGFKPQMAVYQGGNNFQNYFSGIPENNYGTFYYTVDSIDENWSSGRLFNHQIITRNHGVGDSVDFWIQHYCDGGANTSEDEGCEGADWLVSEDPNVATGTVTSGGGVTGPLSIKVNFTIGGGTQGQDRLGIDTSRISFTGTRWTGGGGALNNYAPTAADSTQTFPLSTMVSICYAGSDNGAGGAAGCPASGSPTGYIPPNVNSSTKFSPNTPIVVGIDPSTTVNLPAGFCNSSNAQSSNSGASCYIPSSGAACLSSPEEYESVAYTYNSATQQITLANLRFPHANNGFMFSVGGLCSSVVEDQSNTYTGGGTSGVINPVYPIIGSVDAHTIYYVTQRTNEGYGLPLLGGSSDGGTYNGGSGIPGTAGQYGALCYSVTANAFSNTGGTVQFNMTNPPGVTSGFSQYNALTVTISATSPTNATYEGAYAQTWVLNNTFTYHPTAPSGTIPTSATVSFCNANYRIMPGARITSVDNQSGGLNNIDGTLFFMPNSMTGVANGDTFRVPHYQQMIIQGFHMNVAKFQPEQYVGQNDNNFSWAGIITGPEPGVHIINNGGGYLGFGGTHAPPFQSLLLGGVWTSLIAGNAPVNSVFLINSCLHANCATPNSNFNLWTLPSLGNQGAQPGFSQDYVNYDPYYKYSQRSTGLYSGRFYDINQDWSSSAVPGNGNSVTTRETGHIIADQDVISPTVSTNNLFTSQLPAITIFGNTFGTPGSGSCSYYIVGHALANPATAVTTPQAFSVPNCPNTLSSSNYVYICMPHQAGWASFDIMRSATNTSIITGLAATGNGLSFSPVEPANYSCAADIGQATSVYVPPTVNTTGGANIRGPVSSYSTQNTSITTPGVAIYDASGNLTSSGVPIVAPVTFTVASFTIPANTSQGSSGSGVNNPATFSMPGLPASGTYLHVDPTGNPAALVGWGGSGGLNIWAWPSGTAGTANYIIINSTGSPITFTSVTFSAAVN